MFTTPKLSFDKYTTIEDIDAFKNKMKTEHINLIVVNAVKKIDTMLCTEPKNINFMCHPCMNKSSNRRFEYLSIYPCISSSNQPILKCWFDMPLADENEIITALYNIFKPLGATIDCTAISKTPFLIIPFPTRERLDYLATSQPTDEPPI